MKLVEGEHYYEEDGLFVFTTLFLLLRGWCCNSGCRHCPYDEDGIPRSEFQAEHPQAFADACKAVELRRRKS